MLFDTSAYRVHLPENVRVFASGANRVAEIEGFAKVGIPIGVSVCELNEEAIRTLIEIGNPVLIDSGAFSEVVFSAAGPRVAKTITDLEWRRRLAIYLRLACELKSKASFIAPDRVGDQRTTLERLAGYRSQIIEVAATGASLLIPLQVGELSHAEFFRAAMDAATVELVPALPLKKAVTTASEIVEFILAAQPARLHLLGIGMENRRVRKLIRLIQHYSPLTSISMDSNRLRAVTGKGRRMTSQETLLRGSTADYVYGRVESECLDLVGVQLDYTDRIATPSGWATAKQLSMIAIAAGLDLVDTSALLMSPDDFLQTPLRSNEELVWIEHPLISFALDRAWEEFVDGTVRTSVRQASVVHAFRNEIIRHQIAA